MPRIFKKISMLEMSVTVITAIIKIVYLNLPFLTKISLKMKKR